MRVHLFPPELPGRQMAVGPGELFSSSWSRFPGTGGVQLAQLVSSSSGTRQGLRMRPLPQHRSKSYPPSSMCVFLLDASSHCQLLKLTCIGCIYRASLGCVTSIAGRYAALRMRTFATTGCSAAPPTVAPAPQQWWRAAAAKNRRTTQFSGFLVSLSKSIGKQFFRRTGVRVGGEQ